MTMSSKEQREGFRRLREVSNMNRTLIRVSSVVGLFLVVVLAPSAAKADTILTYVGNDFTFFHDDPELDGKYREITSVSVAVLLGCDSVGCYSGDVTPLHWYATDELRVVSDTSPNAFLNWASFTLDEFGGIAYWRFDGGTTYPGIPLVQYEMQTFRVFAAFEYSGDGSLAQAPLGPGFDFAGNSNNPGAWTVRQNVDPTEWVVPPVPTVRTSEPSSLLLLVVGTLAALVVRIYGNTSAFACWARVPKRSLPSSALR
jgi:hypothetical protein